MSLGAWLCIRCSGVHRALGAHLSFVRSVDLDKWSSKVRVGVGVGAGAGIRTVPVRADSEPGGACN